MGWRNYQKDVVPFFAVLAAESAIVGGNTLFKAASSRGLSFYVFNTYANVISTLLLLVALFIFPSKTKLPSRKLPLILRICVLGPLGFIGTMIGLKGIELSSPTMDSAMSNLTPAFTFTLAVVFRMEKLAVRSVSFQAKVIGTIVSISGALVVVLYKGPTILSIQPPTTPTSLHWLLESSLSNWVLGGLMLAAVYFICSLWFIVMTDIMKMYPAELVVTFCYSLCNTIISIPVCIVAEADLSAWILRSKIALVAVLFAGFFGFPLFVSMTYSWVLHVKGPVYVASFKPSSIAIAVVMGIIFLGDDLHLGSVIGALILAAGVYAGIWGKAKEEEMLEENGSRSSEPSSSVNVPFLQNVESEGGSEKSLC